MTPLPVRHGRFYACGVKSGGEGGGKAACRGKIFSGLETQEQKPTHGITWRSVVLGLLLIPLNTFWVTVVEVRWYTLDGTSLPLFITPIFILFVLCCLNLLWRKVGIGTAMHRGELTVVYVMLVVSTALAGHDMLQNLFGAISHPYYFATPENEYQKLFFRYLPEYLLISDADALEGFYRGNVNPWTSGLWRAWILPLTLWSVFLSALFAIMLATNVLLRRAWTQNERLVFPLIQLPVAMTQGADGGGIFKEKALWFGFALAFGITLFNGMHVLYPQWPYLDAVKQYNIGQFFVTSPWNAVGHFPISMYPFAIGIAFFIPLDLSFSCWFFFVMRKLFQVFGRTQGWDAATNVGFPFFPEQAAGAWLALGLVIVLGTRSYIRDVWGQAIGRVPEKEPGEAKAYRAAFVTIFLGLMFLAFWSVLLNMKWWVAVLFFGIYLLLSLTITRVRAELGTPHEIFFVSPQNVMVTLFGTSAIGPQTLTALSVMYWFNRGMRCHPMPNMMESFKMGEMNRVNYRSLIWVMALALVAGMVAAYWANLHVTYEAGASAKASGGFKWWLGTESFRDRLSVWLRDGVTTKATNTLYMVGGAAMVVGLKVARAASISWPFHPAGYALAVSYAMDYFWFAFFVSWVIKSLIVRYGGMRFHNRAVPFFLGLILGDFVMGSIWAIVGPVMGVPTYKVFI